jgi:hypothetical protein
MIFPFTERIMNAEWPNQVSATFPRPVVGLRGGMVVGPRRGELSMHLMVPNFPQSSYIGSRNQRLLAPQEPFMQSLHHSVAVLAAISCLSVAACAQPPTLTILHTNDMHATFVPREAIWVKETPKPMVGGFKQLEYAIASPQRPE